MTFSLELALDRIEAALAAELPPHMAAFARAHAASTPAPPAPPILTDPTTLSTAERAMEDPALAARGRRLWRQCALLAIEHEIALPRTGAWPALVALARAREAAARRRWGRGFLALAHEVYEVGTVTKPSRAIGHVPPAPAPALTEAGLLELWRRLTDLRPPTLVVAPVRPRTFIVHPGEVIVVVRAEPTVSAWSQAVHELGHALAARSSRELSRTADEAFAITTARRLESDLAPDPEFAAAAQRLHARQHELAVTLAATERSLYSGASLGSRREPPWALFHDPGAQAAYASAFA